MGMIEKNIFRPLISVANKRAPDIETLEKHPHKVEVFFTDPAWPYLHGVYMIFLQIVSNTEID